MDVFNAMLAKEELTEEQINLCRDIRYAILMGQYYKNQSSTTFWPEKS
jgi:hypothetical protein